MKVVILAGGMGTRLSEETQRVPKPLVEIGGQPILWHIMKIYGHYGFTDFVICCGYKGYLIKEYFDNFLLHRSDVMMDLETGERRFLESKSEPWRVTLVDTGIETMTGGRLKRVGHLLGDHTFCMTYGDGLADVDVRAIVESHRRAGKDATVLAIRPPARFGALKIVDGTVVAMQEKPPGNDNWINGGFFVLEPTVLHRIADDLTMWEGAPMERLARDRKMNAFLHTGFWQPMDTLRDRMQLEQAWASGAAPWKVWT